jgi:hypothetical protein
LPLSTIIQEQNCSIALPLDTPITISRDLADSTLANGSLLGELEELNKEVDRTRERYPKAWSRKMTMLIQINNIWKLISSRERTPPYRSVCNHMSYNWKGYDIYAKMHTFAEHLKQY